jgi:hypothetical protein
MCLRCSRVILSAKCIYWHLVRNSRRGSSVTLAIRFTNSQNSFSFYSLHPVQHIPSRYHSPPFAPPAPAHLWGAPKSSSGSPGTPWPGGRERELAERLHALRVGLVATPPPRAALEPVAQEVGTATAARQPVPHDVVAPSATATHAIAKPSPTVPAAGGLPELSAPGRLYCSTDPVCDSVPALIQR